ncbi:MAG TPA: glycosyltransferase [Pilimelia sp.]|nr:glycosyltransferase [Pilimelia sp.]
MAVAPARRVAVCTPWYPTRQRPFGGTFVKAMVEAVAAGCDDISLFHFDQWPAQLTPAAEAEVLRTQAALGPVLPRQAGHVAGARFAYHPVPVPVGVDRAGMSRRHAAAMRRAFGGAVPAPVVHAHVGAPTGWAALQNLAPGARLFVTEHVSFLGTLLEDPAVRQMYGEVLSGCTRFFAVGSVLRDQLAAAFPRHAGKLVVLPNPVAFGEPRPTPVRTLRRWIYVGSLIPRKAVQLVVEAFARCRAADPQLTLTLVGDGPERGRLEALAAARGVADAVTFAGAVDHAATARLMRAHDLLLHASRWETFGMTVVEAVAAGMPVLVTRCGGPEETLAEVAGLAAELVDVTDTPDALVSGYDRLRRRLPALDLPEARRRLEARYAPAAVAAAYHRHWFGEPAVTPGVVPPPRQRRRGDLPSVPAPGPAGA